MTSRRMSGSHSRPSHTVSVVVPTYNRPELVRRAVNSVLQQTHENLECIVVDSDSDTPATTALADINDNRLEVIRLEEDHGLQHAKNVAIEATESAYIAFLDDDDVWLPEKLERQLTFIEANEFDGCVTLRSVIDESGTTTPSNGYMSKYRALMGDLRTQPMSTLLVARAPVEAIDGFDEAFPFQHEDREFCIRLLEHADIGVLNEPLIQVDRADREAFPEPDALLAGKRALLSKHRNLLRKMPWLARRRILAYNRLELALSYSYHGFFLQAALEFTRALAPPILSPTNYLFFISVTVNAVKQRQ